MHLHIPGTQVLCSGWFWGPHEVNRTKQTHARMRVDTHTHTTNKQTYEQKQNNKQKSKRTKQQ